MGEITYSDLEISLSSVGSRYRIQVATGLPVMTPWSLRQPAWHA